MMINGQPQNEDSGIILSVLICCIPDRFASLERCYKKVLSQAEGKPVEVLAFMDNKKRSIGRKRNAMTSLAQGKYFILLDDDDDCSDDYVDELLKAAESDADIISFDQLAIVGGLGRSVVNFSLNNPNDEFNADGITRRKPFSVCAFKTSKFAKVSFGDKMYGEDMIFSSMAWDMAESEYHIDKILHTYIYDPQVTAAK